MVDINLTPYLQEKVKQAQNIQQQLESIIAQKYQIDLKIKEIEKTLEELEKVEENQKVYKISGSILVEVKDREKLKKEFEDEKEMLTIRSNTLEKQKKLLEEKYAEIEKEFEEAYKKQ
ncbi:MAG: prefoldin subunit beta [Thermoplasmata archaeon]|jgi:prefoldin beta subunit